MALVSRGPQVPFDSVIETRIYIACPVTRWLAWVLNGFPCPLPLHQCLIIGGGPCGLRTAIELALLGAKVVVLEKRDSFSRNNVLHLWPYTIHDLRGLGAKKFYGKFCAGAIDHISKYHTLWSQNATTF